MTISSLIFSGTGCTLTQMFVIRDSFSQESVSLRNSLLDFTRDSGIRCDISLLFTQHMCCILDISMCCIPQFVVRFHSGIRSYISLLFTQHMRMIHATHTHTRVLSIHMCWVPIRVAKATPMSPVLAPNTHKCHTYWTPCNPCANT